MAEVDSPTMPLNDFLGGPADTGVKKTENDAAYDVDSTSGIGPVILMSETYSEDGEVYSPPSPSTPTRTSHPTESTPQHSPQSVIDVAFVEGLQRDLAKNQAELARSLKQHREDRAQQMLQQQHRMLQTLLVSPNYLFCSLGQLRLPCLWWTKGRAWLNVRLPPKRPSWRNVK